MTILGLALVLVSLWVAPLSMGGPPHSPSNGPEGSAPPAPQHRALTLVDQQRVDPFAGPGAATVLVFIERDCPISNRYAPELNRLHEAYAARGIRFWLVYAGPEPRDALLAHRREYGLQAPALLDPDYALVDRAGVTIAPEAAVFGAGGDLLYRGRIDDRAVSFSVVRPRARTRDLANVLEGIASGAAVEPRTTQAIGCYIKPFSSSSSH